MLIHPPTERFIAVRLYSALATKAAELRRIISPSFQPRLVSAINTSEYADRPLALAAICCDPIAI
jgi:hypothetical protein